MASAFQITVMINTNVTVHPDTMGTTVKQVNYRTGMKKKILCFQPLQDKFEDGTALHQGKSEIPCDSLLSLRILSLCNKQMRKQQMKEGNE